MSRKICVVTGTRADYGLLYWPMKEIEQDPELELQLVVTGTHLEEKYGLTKKHILEDGFKVSGEIPCDLTSDRPSDICGSMAKVLMGFAQVLGELRPDVVVVLGDRFEIQAIAQACMVCNIPLAHIHGGEATLGIIDDCIRHSITKMAQIHFTSNESYRRRVIQMGESPEHVFTSGAPGLDNIRKLPLLGKDELAQVLGIEWGRKNLLVTYHPITLYEDVSRQESRDLFAALTELDPHIQVFLTMPNSDTYSEHVRADAAEFLKKRPKARAFMNLGQLRYLSLMNAVDAVVGNSSSGIIEAPFLGRPVVNVGLRQKGRAYSPEHVIQSESGIESVLAAVNLAMSPAFAERASHPSLLNGNGHAAPFIKEKLKEVKLDKILYKTFHDLGPKA